MGSLGASVLVYQSAFPTDVATAEVDQAPEAEPQQPAEVEATPAYQGVDDPWVMGGHFTIGDAALDAQIKEFCDCLSGEGTSAAVAAQTVFNNMVWGNYTPREAGQQPQGRDWSWVAARLYFDAAKPQEGEAGDGDYYEYSAALTCCLRYFGYTYVTALPIVTYDEWGNQTGSAITYVMDENGNRYVCDPSQGTQGWMLDAYTQDITVDDIGQDLSDAEMLGLPIASSRVETGEVASADAWGTDAASTEEVGYTEDTGYADYTDYGYDEWGTYDEWGNPV